MFTLLGPAGEIKECLKASREVVPANGSGTDRGYVALGVWEKKLEFSLKEGQTSCEDILKVSLSPSSPCLLPPGSCLNLAQLWGVTGSEQRSVGRAERWFRV